MTHADVRNRLMTNESDVMDSRYLPQLDSLRAIAIFMVVWSHWMPTESQLGLPWGHFGVQLFFVLSGFLITRILLRSKPGESSMTWVALRTFYVRRALRIFPAYYTMLAVLWVLNFNNTRETFCWHVAYLTNFYLCVTQLFSPLAHFWSLAVEEQFYLFWPLVVLWSSRQTLRRFALMMVVASPFFRIIAQEAFPTLDTTLLTPSFMDALGSGALLALTEDDKELQSLYRHAQLYFCLPVFLTLQFVAAARGISPLLESIRQVAMVVSFAAIVSGATSGFHGIVGSILSASRLAAIGKISYGIYLLHNVAPHLVRSIFEYCGSNSLKFDSLNPAWRFVLLCLTTLAIASMSWLCLERPMLKLKNRLANPSRISSSKS